MWDVYHPAPAPASCRWGLAWLKYNYILTRLQSDVCMSIFKPVFALTLATPLVFSACSKSDAPAPDAPIQIERVITKDDKFTYANYDKVQLTHLDLNLDVDFDRKVLEGVAVIDFRKLDGAAREFVLDTKDLVIHSVAVSNDAGTDWTPVQYTLAEPDTMMGQKLTVPLTSDAAKVKIDYATSPAAEGLQWLAPEQTAGKKYPYLFSQAQAINARTIAPVQDTPAVRHTYSATLRVPDGLRPLMSASQGDLVNGEYKFDMPQPIPSYLLAIAVGDIKFKAINDTIGVYAEDYILDAAAEEFSETPMMEDANEALYGPYLWGRYDLIVLPPSFPFGGMENPRLSFLTPTLVAGDKSLTNVVAHELAHSWSGNLVTNSSWRDAWLNEGFTSYVENRVMEALYGPRRAVMEQALALDDLKRDLPTLSRPELSQLKLPADIAHPDDAFTQVAYVKGQFFLIFLEERFGREAFDPFLKSWFNENAFKSVTTEDFLTYLDINLRQTYPDAVTDAEIAAWVYSSGLPDTAKNPKSNAFTDVMAQMDQWYNEEISVADIETADWSTHEWLHFLNGLPDTLSQRQFKELDEAFALTGTQNAETAFAWYMNAIQGQYAPALPALEDFLMTVGRGKFIYRLYAKLADSGQADFANRVYKAARSGYHPIAQRRIDAILEK